VATEATTAPASMARTKAIASVLRMVGSYRVWQ
jgi:hypothetical protein